MKTKTDELVAKITSNTTQLTMSTEFQEWLKGESLHDGDLIVINNSVLYRDVKTKKSLKYLVLNILSVSPLSYDIKIINYPEEQRKNADFSRLSKNRNTGNLEITDLDKAIEEELDSLGRLIFILIGEIDTSEIFEQTINHILFNKIVLDSALDVPLRLQEQTIYAREIPDTELLWEQFVKAYGQESSLPDNFVGEFSTALSELKKKSYVKLRIPDPKILPQNCFIDQIIYALKQTMREYANSLANCANPNQDRMEYNNILRIAYTFAEEIIRVLRLMISISDLKPLIFWLTTYEQFQFSYAIKSLPWEKLGTKADLKKYVETVKGARNKAFHNLLQFNQTIDVQMGNITIRPKKLRLFTEFTSKGNIFEYEDKELIETLIEFTRAGENYVSFDFWKRNLEVMVKTLCLLEAISSSLKSSNV